MSSAPPRPALDVASYRLPPELTERTLSPALVVYLERVRENVARVIEIAGGVDRWRPHVKTSKIPAVWREMARAGLRHFKCATTREANELLACLLGEGIEDADVLLAYPLLGPALGRLGLTGVNFGPTVTVDKIREHLPGAVIQGCLAPFTYSRDQQRQMVLEFLRDFEMSKERRGLWFTTAGSINDGSRLAGMRLLMSATQRFGRY